jgi:hypothetical protein
MKLNEINLEDMIKIGKEMEKTKNSWNPLFVNPNSAPNTNIKNKVRI